MATFQFHRMLSVASLALVLGLSGCSKSADEEKTSDSDSDDAPEVVTVDCRSDQPAAFDPRAGLNTVYFGKESGLVVLRCKLEPDPNEVVEEGEERPSKGVQVYDLSTGKTVSPKMRHEEEVARACFSENGTHVATIAGQSARVWDAKSGEAITPQLLHEDKVQFLAFNPSGSRLATASVYEKIVRIWDTKSGKMVAGPLKHYESSKDEGDGPWHIVFSPDGKRLLANTPKGARMWDPETGKMILRVHHDGDTGNSFGYGCFTRDGEHFVTCNIDNTARVWNSATGELAYPPLQHEDRVSFATTDPNGKYIATGSFDGNAKVWNAKSGEIVTTIKLPSVESIFGSQVDWIAFHPVTDHLLTYSGSSGLQQWDIETAKPVGKPIKTGMLSFINLTYCRSGQGMAGTNMETANIAEFWNLKSGKSVRQIFVP